MTEDQLKAALQEQFGIMKSELKDELKKEFNLQAPEPPQESEEKPEQFSVQQFSEELQKHIAPVMEKVNGLETQFAELKQEKPGQKPGEEGNGGDDENKFNAKDMY
ncbi:Hypothetical protein FORC18_4024 [Vibrio parahaemolyticus]|nr:Hypothetical protein FORC18_4024 [Vibrio parahaemolyticus]